MIEEETQSRCVRITAATFSARKLPFTTSSLTSHTTRPTHALISSKSEGGGCSEDLHIASPSIISGGTCSQPLPELTNSFGPKTNKQRSRTNSGNALEPAQPVIRNSSHTPELYAWNFIVGLHQKDTKQHAYKWDRCNMYIF